VIVRNAEGFDLALHPGDPPEQLPAFLHFGFQLADADAVAGLLAKMEARRRADPGALERAGLCRIQVP
jgi:hypothetical protein